MLRGYPASLLTIPGALNQPSLSVSKSLRKVWAVSRSQQHHLHVIRSVLVSLLFILQSPNIGFDNFAVIIASAVAAKKQQSNEAQITVAKTSHLSHVIITQTIKPHAACARKTEPGLKSPEKTFIHTKSCCLQYFPMGCSSSAHFEISRAFSA